MVAGHVWVFGVFGGKYVKNWPKSPPGGPGWPKKRVFSLFGPQTAVLPHIVNGKVVSCDVPGVWSKSVFDPHHPLHPQGAKTAQKLAQNPPGWPKKPVFRQIWTPKGPIYPTMSMTKLFHIMSRVIGEHQILTPTTPSTPRGQKLLKIWPKIPPGGPKNRIFAILGPKWLIYPTISISMLFQIISRVRGENQMFTPTTPRG